MIELDFRLAPLFFYSLKIQQLWKRVCLYPNLL